MSLHIRDYDLDSVLAGNAAVEIDNYILGNRNGLPSIEKIIEITQKNSVHSDSFPHFAFLHSLENYESLMYMTQSILAVREKLFEYELQDVKSLPKERLENLRDFLSKFSREISSWKNYLHRPIYKILAFPKEAVVSPKPRYRIIAFPKEALFKK